MEQSKRRTRDLVSIKRTVWSNYDKFRTLGAFYQEKSEVVERIAALPDEEIARIAAECRDGGVRWRNFAGQVNKLETALLDGREIVDRSQEEGRALTEIMGVPAGELVRIRETASGVQVSFAVSGTFDVLCRGNRNGCFRVHGMGVTPETEFTVVNELLPFWEDRYSVALRDPAGKCGFAISAEDPKTGKKGSACIRIYVLEENRVVIDDLGKYTDTSALTLWINP